MILLTLNGCDFFSVEKRVTFKSGKFRLSGDLYIQENGYESPWIIFLHGTSLEGKGRDLPLYEMLCDEFYIKGYNVFSYDARSYGESEGPERIDSPDDFDFIGDVSRAIDFLEERADGAIGSIVVVGHSFGGGVAIPAGLKDDRIKRIVSISPPRRIQERFFSDDSEKDFHWVWKKKSEVMGLKELIPKEMMRPMLESYDIEMFIDRQFNKPLLLIDGALEEPKDREFLKKMYTCINGVKKYVTIDKAKHFFGTTMQGKVVDETIVGDLANEIDMWIKSS
jgi:pimeloyl-ACP methyl ester carboxylesterase